MITIDEINREREKLISMYKEKIDPGLDESEERRSKIAIFGTPDNPIYFTIKTTHSETTICGFTEKGILLEANFITTETIDWEDLSIEELMCLGPLVNRIVGQPSWREM